MLQALITSILADGKIDANEVKQLREAIFADGKVDKEEADALFTLNDAVSESGEFDPSFTSLFIEAISSYVLEDEATPGEVDADEAKYLIDQISGDGAMDENEQKLLRRIQTKATKIDSSLDQLINLIPEDVIDVIGDAVEAISEAIIETVTEETVEETVSETETAPVAETVAASTSVESSSPSVQSSSPSVDSSSSFDSSSSSDSGSSAGGE